MGRFIMRLRDSSGVAAFENIIAEQQVREHDAGGKKVRTLVGDLKIRLLRAHVIGFAGDDFAFLVLQKSSRFGDAEIRQLHVAFKGDHDVFEADVAMDDAQRFAVLVGFGMRVSEAARDAAGDEHRQFHGQMRALLSATARRIARGSRRESVPWR